MTVLNWLLVVLAVLGMGLAIAQLQRARRAEHALINKSPPRELQTRLTELEQQATATNAALATLAESMPDPIFFVDAEHRITFHNTAAKKFLGEGCAPGRTLMEVARSYELDALAEDVTNDKEVQRELTLNSRLFRSYASKLNSGALLVLRDVSELQRLGRARRDFVANISHELRTPLTAIRLLADTLRQASPVTPQQDKLLVSIGDQTDALTQLAQEMYDLSLIESGQLPMRMVVASLHESAANVLARLKPQAARAGLQLANEIDLEERALFDENQIQRVLSNLVHNAIKFTPSGSVTVFTAQAHSDAERVAIGVRDTGVGIPSDELPRIFERFYKVDRARGQAGTGLGLAIAKHIVEAHGGSIWAESALGKGTTFYFTMLREE
jgi:two-component system phosphate regulon sensor histidine kinase PhoR